MGDNVRSCEAWRAFLVFALEARHLRYFVAVAEETSFRRAAARLRLAQPSLRRQIHDLEAAIGEPLLDRRRKQVALTAAGRAFRGEARFARRCSGGGKGARRRAKRPRNLAHRQHRHAPAAAAALGTQERLASLTCPPLVLAGAEDPGTPPSAARLIGERIKGGRVEIIPGASRMVTLEAPEAVNRLIETFISQA